MPADLPHFGFEHVKFVPGVFRCACLVARCPDPDFDCDCNCDSDSESVPHAEPIRYNAAIPRCPLVARGCADVAAAGAYGNNHFARAMLAACDFVGKLRLMIMFSGLYSIYINVYVGYVGIYRGP